MIRRKKEGARQTYFNVLFVLEDLRLNVEVLPS